MNAQAEIYLQNQADILPFKFVFFFKYDCLQLWFLRGKLAQFEFQFRGGGSIIWHTRSGLRSKLRGNRGAGRFGNKGIFNSNYTKGGTFAYEKVKLNYKHFVTFFLIELFSRRANKPPPWGHFSVGGTEQTATYVSVSRMEGVVALRACSGLYQDDKFVSFGHGK